MSTLRPYQSDLINQARTLFKNKIKNIILQLPTGGGKTKLTASMIKGSLSKNKKSLFIVHRRELIEQSALAFEQEQIPFGIISSGFQEDYDKPVQIASIQTLKRRLHLLKHKYDLVVFDECQHQAAKDWSLVHDYFSGSFKIGLTATPIRLDGKGLDNFYSDIIQGPSMKWLIKAGYLSDYKIFAPSNISLEGIKTQMGDYKKSDLKDLMDRPKFTGDAITEYKNKLKGNRAIVFCVNIEHSQHVAQEFNNNGISAAHLDGTHDRSFRKETLEQFKNGEILVLCNVDLFGEGFDLPTIDGVILLRPTQSLSLYLQQVGRALRMYSGKTHAVILDHVRNVEKHGLPCDEREWSLQGIKKSNDKNNIGVKICPECMAALKNVARHCDYCGHIFVINPREFDILNSTTNDELKELDKNNYKKPKKDIERISAVSKDDLIQLAIKRGYKRPHAWAHYVFQARQKKKINHY